MRIYIFLLVVLTIISFYLNYQKEYLIKNALGDASNEKLNYLSRIEITSYFLFLVSLPSLKSFLVGNDTVTYYSIFRLVRNVEWNKVFEIGYEPAFIFLNKFIGSFTNQFIFVQIVISFICIIPILLYFIKNSTNMWFSTVVFICMNFYNFIFSGYRQAIAISITVLAIKYINEKKLLKFVLTVFLASLFHQSALIFLIAYPLNKIKISIKYVLIAFFGSIVLYFGGYEIIPLLLNNYDRHQIVILGEGNNYLLLLFLMTFFGIMSNKFSGKHFLNYNLLTHMMILACIVQVMALNMSILNRVGYYFAIHMTTYLPNAINSFNNRIIKFILYLIIGISSFIYYIYILNIDLLGIVPYLFYWE